MYRGIKKLDWVGVQGLELQPTVEGFPVGVGGGQIAPEMVLRPEITSVLRPVWQRW